MHSGSKINWFKYAAPPRLYALAGKLVPVSSAAALVLAAVGLWLGLGVAPTDAQQGDAYRIIFIHVPAAWMSMVVYVAMAFWAGVGLVFNVRPAAMLSMALAPTGAWMTAIALWTGALWGRPTWGAWWVWDARLTSELILLFLYVGVLALHAAIDDPRRAGPLGGAAGARRRRQRADHLFFGQMVEHAAPGRDGQPVESPEHRHADAARHAGDGARVLGLLHRGVDGAPARGAARARAPQCLGRRGLAGSMMSIVWGSWAQFAAMGGYGVYVWGAFGATVAAMVVETAGIASRRRALRDRFPADAAAAEWQP